MALDINQGIRFFLSWIILSQFEKHKDKGDSIVISWKDTFDEGFDQFINRTKKTEFGVEYIIYEWIQDDNECGNSKRKTHKKIYYTVDNKIHREKGPAYVYTIDNIKEETAFFINDKLHRENYPALYIKNEKEYWINDRRLSLKDLRKLKLKKINNL